MDKQVIGENIRRWRQFRGLKQAELAKLARLSRSTLSRWENGKGELTVLRLYHLAELLKIEVSNLSEITPAKHNKFEG